LKYFCSSPDDISFLVGASSWSSGQLESEIAQGFWIPTRAPAEIALTGICEHDPSVPSKSKRPLADLWLSMMSACGEDEANWRTWCITRNGMKMLCLVISLMTNFKIAIRAFLTCIPKSAFTSYVDTFHIKSSILVVVL
jgi:hypothetical protein